MIQPESPRASWWLWAAAPVLTLVAAQLSTYAIDAVRQIGPFDRAWLGWAITIPLVLISPWLAARAAQRAADTSRAWLAVLVPASLVAIGLTVELTLSAKQIGCERISNPLQALPNGLAVGVTSLLAFALAAGVTTLVPTHRPFVALFVSAATAFVAMFGVVFVFAIAFPAVSCAPRP